MDQACEDGMERKADTRERPGKSLAIALRVSLLGALAAGPGSSAIRLTSSNAELADGFAWAAGEALGDAFQAPIGPAYKTAQWALFCARDMAHQSAGAHLLGMDAANRNLLGRFAASASSAAGWYVVWALNYDGGFNGKAYKGPDNCVREAPTDFDLIESAYQLYLWTGDSAYFRDSTLWAYYGHALRDFVAAHDAWRANGVVEGESGDIYKGIATYTENGEFLRESADALGCQYRATSAYARFLALRGQADSAAAYAKRADALLTLFRTGWWDDQAQRYRRGIGDDGKWRTDYTVQTYAMILREGLAEPGPRAQGVVALVKANGDGDNFEARTYQPEAYYPYGERDQAFKALLAQYRDRNTYPEVPFTGVSTAVQGLMGMEPDAPGGALATTCNLPDTGADWVTVDSVPMGDHLLKLTHRRQGRTESSTLKPIGAGPLRWTARFYGKREITVDGKVQAPENVVMNGLAMTQCTLSLADGREVTVMAGAPDPVSLVPRKRSGGRGAGFGPAPGRDLLGKRRQAPDRGQ